MPCGSPLLLGLCIASVTLPAFALRWVVVNFRPPFGSARSAKFDFGLPDAAVLELLLPPPPEPPAPDVDEDDPLEEEELFEDVFELLPQPAARAATPKPAATVRARERMGRRCHLRPRAGIGPWS